MVMFEYDVVWLAVMVVGGSVRTVVLVMACDVAGHHYR